MATKTTQPSPRSTPRTIPAIAPLEMDFFLESPSELLEFVGKVLEVAVERSAGSARMWGEEVSSKMHWETLNVRLL